MQNELPTGRARIAATCASHVDVDDGLDDVVQCFWSHHHICQFDFPWFVGQVLPPLSDSPPLWVSPIRQLHSLLVVAMVSRFLSQLPHSRPLRRSVALS